MNFDEAVYSDSGLGKWYNREKWVDISRKDKSGKHPPCGASAGKGRRKKNQKSSYPKCRPSAEASRMSKSEKKRAVSQKRRAESKSSHTGKGRSPVMVSHKKKRKKMDENTQNFNESKKKKPSKNKPNNPTLWASCIAAAKEKFDVYPCLPISYAALTPDGEKYFNELKVGDEIYAFDLAKKEKVITKIIEMNKFQDAPTLDIYADGHYFCTATHNHKWVVEINGSYDLVETQDLNQAEKLFVDSNKEFLTNIEHNTGFVDDVWCPTTSEGTWYTVINGEPCVTGNSAYANLWASKEYKRRGGTWRKGKSSKRKNMITESNEKFQRFCDWIESRHPDFNES